MCYSTVYFRYTGITGFSEFARVQKQIFSAMSQVGKISFFDIAVQQFYIIRLL